MKVLENLQPAKVFKYFEEMSMIPRGSGNEKGISDYLVNFAKERNLEVIQDEALNVIIKKKASKGYENAPGVIIQGHMDMVCEKTKESTHDFMKDPLQLRVEGDNVYATNTTLGADNGIAVAYALAILDDDSISHPALEVLVTTDEETGMGGAMALDGSLINGKYLLNRDSEEEQNRARTEKSFFVPKEEIVENDYDLSINKYKEIVVEKKEYEKPEVILKRVIDMEDEIQQKLKELEEML